MCCTCRRGVLSSGQAGPLFQVARHQRRHDVTFVLSVGFLVFTWFSGSVVVAFVPNAVCNVRHDVCTFFETVCGRDGGISM